jgi:hypothetical protein
MKDSPPPAPQRVALGEESVTKVVGIYPTQESAAAAHRGLTEAHIVSVLLSPSDARQRRQDFLSKSFEPESHGIWHTIIRTHLLGGAIGATVGLCLWGVLRAQGQSMVSNSPLVSLIFIVFLTTAVGLMAGGLISLRPDHSSLFHELRGALRDGAYAVVAHPTDSAATDAAARLLEPGSQRVARTL